MKYALFVFLGLTIVLGAAYLFRSKSVGRSGESFRMGNSDIIVVYGYAEGGKRLRFAVVRSFPSDTPPNKKIQDPRIQDDYLDTLSVRGNDGHMIRVETDGTIYLFDGDHLRTMKVNMSESMDTVGISRCKSMEEIWAFFKRFEVQKPLTTQRDK